MSVKTYRLVIIYSPGVAAPYIMQDLKHAFEQQKHTVFVLDLRVVENLTTTKEKLEYLLDMRRQIKRFKPQFAIGYNTSVFISLPPNNPEQHFFEELKIPYVSLFFDNPSLHAMLTPCSTLFVPFIWDRYYLECFSKRYHRKAFFLPLATNPERFKPMADIRALSADVAFIGSVSNIVDFNLTRQKAGWHDWMIAFAKGLVQSYFSFPDIPIEELIQIYYCQLDAVERELIRGLERQDIYIPFMVSLYRQIGDAMRYQRVSALKDIDVNIHGPDAWCMQAEDRHTYKGAADYLTDTPQIYNSARINLNISGAQLITAVNQRVFDVSACGAFILTDYRKDLEIFFDLQTEIAVYYGNDDMKEKVAYYLSNPEIRRQMSDRARRRVLAEHTYVHRTKTILSVLVQEQLI